MGVFCFIDGIAELKKNESLTAHYTLRGEEEFLLDHFSGFPVMPGVLLLEALKQAAVSLLTLSGGGRRTLYRLVAVEEAKFGQFVRPGSRLEMFVRFLRKEAALNYLEGRIDLVDSPDGVSGGKALTASLTLAPVL